MKSFVFKFKFYQVLFVVQLEISIGSDNGLVPNRWKVITWTNDEKVLWHHMASLGQNELNRSTISGFSVFLFDCVKLSNI